MRLDHLDYLGICRDDQCELSELHPAHRVDVGSKSRANTSVIRVGNRRLLVDLAYAAISPRIPKTFKQIYVDVCDEYGSITERNVYAALGELRNERQIALIVPAGSQDKVQREGIRGAYLRYDSPLLWTRDGLCGLMEQVHEMVGDPERRAPRCRRPAHVNHSVSLRPAPVLDAELAAYGN